MLQEGEYTTVGGRTSIRSNVRIVAATHHDLRSLITQGLFREDLYFRLSVVPIRLPPLRERTSDIPELARHFMARAASEGLPSKILDGRAMERLKTTAGRVTYVNWRTSSDALQHCIPEEGDRCRGDRSGARRCIASDAGTGSRRLGKLRGTTTADLLQCARRRFACARASSTGSARDRKPLIMLTLEATRGNQIRAAEVLASIATRFERKSAI